MCETIGKHTSPLIPHHPGNCRSIRDNPDDGALTALLLGPLVATTLLYVSESMASAPSPPSIPLPEAWLVEDPPVLPNTRHPLTALEALVRSRRNLVQLMTLTSGILLVHLFATRMGERRHALRNSSLDGGAADQPPLPRREGNRSMSQIGFTAILTAGALVLKALFVHTEMSVWPGSLSLTQ